MMQVIHTSKKQQGTEGHLLKEGGELAFRAVGGTQLLRLFRCRLVNFGFVLPEKPSLIKIRFPVPNAFMDVY